MFLFKTANVCLFCLLVSVTFAQPSAKSITAKEAVAEAEKVVSDCKEKYLPTSKADWEKGKIQIGSDSLLFTVKVFGEKPSDGRSMFISMHGGGSGPASMNDQQYKNQQRLYKPAEGVYFVPRAPSNTWNMWHQEPVDRLLERAILDARQNGKVLFKGKVARRKELIQQSYADRRDADYIFSSEVVVVKGKVSTH